MAREPGVKRGCFQRSRHVTRSSRDAVPEDAVAISSFSPALLDAVAADPGWHGGSLVAELLPPTRASLDGFHVSGVSVDPFQLDAEAFERFSDLGVDVALWSDLVTPEMLDWIASESPRWVDVGDAALVRSWIDG